MAIANYAFGGMPLSPFLTPWALKQSRLAVHVSLMIEQLESDFFVVAHVKHPNKKTTEGWLNGEAIKDNQGRVYGCRDTQRKISSISLLANVSFKIAVSRWQKLTNDKAELLRVLSEACPDDVDCSLWRQLFDDIVSLGSTWTNERPNSNRAEHECFFKRIDISSIESQLESNSAPLITPAWGEALIGQGSMKAYPLALFVYLKHAPFIYGYWAAWKKLFKEIESDHASCNAETIGVMLARIDESDSCFLVGHSEHKGDMALRTMKPFDYICMQWRALKILHHLQDAHEGYGIPTKEFEVMEARTDKLVYIDKSGSSFFGGLYYWRDSRGTIQTYPRPIGNEALPTRKTLDYMRRRARRLLRNLAEQHSEKYIDVCLAYFSSLKADRKFLLQKRWLLCEMLFGNAIDLRQAGHGRGRMLLPSDVRWSQQRRELCQRHWNSRRSEVLSLITSDVPLVVAEFAARIAIDQGWHTEHLQKYDVNQFLCCGSPVLAKVALGRILRAYKRVEQRALDWTYASPKRKGWWGRPRKILSISLIFRSVAVGLVTVGDQCRSQLELDVHINRLAQSNRELLAVYVDEVVYGLSRECAKNRRPWPDVELLLVALWALRLPWCLKFPEPYDGIEKGRSDRWFYGYYNYPVYLPYWPPEDQEEERVEEELYYREKWLRRRENGTDGWSYDYVDDLWGSGWRGDGLSFSRFVSYSTSLYNPTRVPLGQPLGDDIIVDSIETDRAEGLLREADLGRLTILAARDGLPGWLVLAIAGVVEENCTKGQMTESHRLKIFAIAQALLPSLPRTAGQRLFRKALAHYSCVELIELVMSISESEWESSYQCGAILPRNSLGTNVFCQAAWNALDGERGELVLARTFANPVWHDAMHRVFEPRQLVQLNGLQVRVLLDCFQCFPKRFKMGSDLLFSLCACTNSQINQAALSHAEQLGVTAVFGLRLIESQLPAAATVGERFFRSLSANSKDLERAVILLCDSALAFAQELGLELMRLNKDVLPLARLLRKLAESPYDRIRLFVAAEIIGTATVLPLPSEFDSTVLRTRGRSRAVKDMVKTRLETASLAPRNTKNQRYLDSLRQLANGMVPKDRDWALAELVRLANQGVDIVGLEVSSLQEEC